MSEPLFQCPICGPTNEPNHSMYTLDNDDGEPGLVVLCPKMDRMTTVVIGAKTPPISNDDK